MGHPKGASSPIPCLGHWVHTVDGSDFDCDYANSGGFGCEDCIINGGRMDPRTGKRLARRNGGIGMSCRPEDCKKRPALVARLYNKQEKELIQVKEWATIVDEEADKAIARLEADSSRWHKQATKLQRLLREVLAFDSSGYLSKNLHKRIVAACKEPKAQ